MRQNIKSTRLFFSQIEKDTNVNLLGNLERSSNGTIGALSRLETYRQVCSEYDYLTTRHQKLRSFNSSTGAGYGDSASALSATHAIDATIRAYTSSIAGFFCKEVSINQANALVNHFDTLDILEDQIISPNLGAPAKNLLKRADIKAKVTVAALEVSLNTGKAILPKSLRIGVYTAGDVLLGTITDDGVDLVAKPGLVEDATVSFTAGTIEITFPTGSTAAYVNISGNSDASPLSGATAGARNHIKGKMVGFIVLTAPELLTYESNIIQSVAVSRSLNVDMDVFLAEKLAELFTIKINQDVALALKSGYEGDTKAITFAGHSWDNVRSYSDYFYNQMTEVGEALIAKAYRGATMNVILVGKKAALPFLKLAQNGTFKKVVNPHMVGLIGYLDDTIPVIRTDDIDDNEGYASHKSDDGEIAALLRAIFLPLTSTPEVGNFDNPTQVVGGIYYQEVITTLYPQMVQRFTVASESTY